jgi:hypothetical protein|tara:strand:+ start:4759 stop:4971 length:213 start_codon:yes stop_codon:yes gene_type:complete
MTADQLHAYGIAILVEAARIVFLITPVVWLAIHVAYAPSGYDVLTDEPLISWERVALGILALRLSLRWLR